MIILGIDYGKKKIGLAIATTMLADVYGVVRSETAGEAIIKIKKIVRKEKVQKVIVGVSEGEIARETKGFAEKLKKELQLPIIFQDETLSTVQAQTLARQAGVRRKKRKEFEDAFAAVLILQAYLDSR